MLNAYSLPFFHMVECAHRKCVFGGISAEASVEIERRMIGIIKRRVEFGFAFTVNEAEYNAQIGDRTDILGDAYCKCLKMCLQAVTQWIEKHGVDTQVAYTFESGHRSQGAAESMMRNTFKMPVLKQVHHYLCHSFMDKASSCGLQAADLLAWQWATDHKRQSQRKGRRLDLESLLECHHRVMHFTASMLKIYRDAGDMLNLYRKDG